jgi:hypothetical protein
MNITKRATYKLNFDKLVTPNGRVRYTCTQAERTTDSIFLSELLDLISNNLYDALIEEIDSAINSMPYEEYFSFDASSMEDSLKISPPIAIINGEYEIQLSDLKQLLLEWKDFCEK